MSAIVGIFQRSGRPLASRNGHVAVADERFVLARGEGVGLEPQRPQERLRSLIANSYAARLGRGLLSCASAHLQQCARVAEAVPVNTLRRSRQLELVPKLASIVETELCPPVSHG